MRITADLSARLCSKQPRVIDEENEEVDKSAQRTVNRPLRPTRSAFATHPRLVDCPQTIHTPLKNPKTQTLTTTTQHTTLVATKHAFTETHSNLHKIVSEEQKRGKHAHHNQKPIP